MLQVIHQGEVLETNALRSLLLVTSVGGELHDVVFSSVQLGN